jgi:DnaJ-class molecular chaperone
MKSFYEMLEVSPQASSAVIRAAYRCLAQHDHPDKNPASEDAIQRMTNINRAYAVLADAAKRQAYDLSQDNAQGICERRSLNSMSPDGCVFRFNVTGDSGIVTAVPANVTRGVPAT